jgi:hypothetical protein
MKDQQMYHSLAGEVIILPVSREKWPAGRHMKIHHYDRLIGKVFSGVRQMTDMMEGSAFNSAFD